MDTNFLDSDIPHAFWPSMSEAKRRALKEAVDTGGIVFDVQAIELEKSLLVLSVIS